jgi:squalene-hopene/tetraprenyl-beta-curcumene cyclase
MWTALALSFCLPVTARGTAPLHCAPLAASPAHRGDPKMRRAAERGLDFLTRASAAWTQQHACFGCHVQAVTLEALSVGRHHQYEIAAKDLDATVRALMLGVTAGGRVTGAAFEGSAFARYDQWVDGQKTDQLLKYAAELLQLQSPDGSVLDDDARRPVTGGTMHTTYQAAQTWRQAFARTADDKWLAPMRRAEAFLSAKAKAWKPGEATDLQDVNFALLGLVSAGVGAAEAPSLRLQTMLLRRQNQDGGWGLANNGQSDAFATGQTVYALKLAGHSDREAAIASGLAYLVRTQDRSGGWRTVRSAQGGSEKGETMWAVLGLVTVDVMSVTVNGVLDGQHVNTEMKLQIDARDNQGGQISRLELRLDDLPIQSRCGSSLAHIWNTKALAPGKHVLDVVAVNARGQESRQRFHVYAGDVFMTEVGAVFQEATQSTRVTLRDIAPAGVEGSSRSPTKKAAARCFRRRKRASRGRCSSTGRARAATAGHGRAGAIWRPCASATRAARFARASARCSFTTARLCSSGASARWRGSCRSITAPRSPPIPWSSWSTPPARWCRRRAPPSRGTIVSRMSTKATIAFARARLASPIWRRRFRRRRPLRPRR